MHHLDGGIKSPRMPRARVTIGQLAEALGLTKGTVSRALNGYPDIADATRLRVKRQAERMGYRPLSQAQAIRTGRTRALGLVLQSDIPGAEWPFLADFLSGISSAASAQSWTLTFATAISGDDMLQTLERLVQERKADGFILPRTLRDDPRANLLKRLDVPFVLYGRVADPTACAWFDILGEDAMRDAVHRLVKHGHRHIAYVNGGPDYNFSELRAAGFRRGMQESGLAVERRMTGSEAMTRKEGAAAVSRLMQLERPPTAIVFATDAAALGAYDAADALGLVIGRDLSVISYDGIPEGGWARPPLTTFNVDTRKAGNRLADLLIKRIEGTKPEALRETARAFLKIGGSDGPPRLTSEGLAAQIRNHH